MRKKIGLAVLVTIGVSLLLATMYWFSTNKIRTINNEWGYLLPYSVDIEDEESFYAMSEGHSYYVIDLNGYDLSNHKIFDNKIDQKEDVQNKYEALVDAFGITVTAEIDWSKEVIGVELKKEQERLFIIVYDDFTKAVIISETSPYVDNDYN